MTYYIKATGHKIITKWLKLIKAAVVPLLSAQCVSIYIMDLSHRGLSLQNPLNNVVVFMKWLMNSFSLLDSQAVFICTHSSVSVMVVGFDWHRAFWLVFMKVVELPCYTQVFALGQLLIAENVHAFYIK